MVAAGVRQQRYLETARTQLHLTLWIFPFYALVVSIDSFTTLDATFVL
jgi:hypothetical protein